MRDKCSMGPPLGASRLGVPLPLSSPPSSTASPAPLLSGIGWSEIFVLRQKDDCGDLQKGSLSREPQEGGSLDEQRPIPPSTLQSLPSIPEKIQVQSADLFCP